MRSVLTAGILAGFVLATPVFAQDEPAEQAYDASTVVATVNGVPITLGHVIVMRGQLPEQYQNLPDEVLLTGLIDQLVDQELLAEALSKSPDTDPPAVKLQVENERRGALAARVATEAVAGAVDEAKVQAAYDKRVAEFEPAPEFSAAHILVDDEEKAKGLKAEIDGGADFAEVAKANSSDGSAANGGELGWFGLGQMVPEFEAAVKEMEVGSVTGPVKTQFGWHLIKLNEKRDTSPPTLDEVRPEIENELRQAALQAKLGELRAAATIERPDTGVPPEAVREIDLVN